jgi:dTDP-4-dehydrorhamnose 3,5-epimerase
MIFTPTRINGVWVLEPQRHEDERGWFSRTWCVEELAEHGACTALAQCSASFNKRRGTLRGMHMQVAPHAEAKVVRCTRGAIFDVALDLRADSPTYGQWEAVELTAENGLALYIPEGCAHGFQTLEDNTEVLYQISAPYHAESGRCWRWDDPVFKIAWPLQDLAYLSPRDAAAPCYDM